MSNVRRLHASDRIFFVTVNVRRGTAPFAEDEFPMLIRALQESRRRLGFSLFGYVLMPDHWHALLFPSGPVTISQVIHDGKKVSARRLNQARKSSGPFWQHQFWDRFVRYRKEFWERMEYMHLNPVARGLVKSPAGWRWSSYTQIMADGKAGAEPLIALDEAYLTDEYRA